MRQLRIKENFNKKIRDKIIQCITNWFYQASMPFNAVKLESFDHMIEAFAHIN